MSLHCRINRIRTRVDAIAITVVMAFASTVSPTHAAVFTWTGAGSNHNMLNSGNWSPTPPATVVGHDLVFGSGSLRTDPFNDLPDSGGLPPVIGRMTFTGNQAYTIGGNSFLLGPSFASSPTTTVSQQSSQEQTIGTHLAAYSDQYWETTAGSGRLSVNAPVNMFNGSIIANVNGGDIWLNGAVSGNNAGAETPFFLGKTGTGRLVARDAVDAGGGVRIQQGTMEMLDSAAHFNSDTPILIQSGGKLIINNTSTDMGALSGDGELELANVARVVVTQGSTFDGVVNGSGSFNFWSGGQTLVLNGQINNDQGLTIYDGTVRLGSTNRIADTLNVELHNPGARLELNGATEYIAGLFGRTQTFNSGVVDLGAGGGSLIMQSTTTDANFFGQITGNGNIGVFGAGARQGLGGSNSFTGLIDIQGGGTLQFGSNSSLGNLSNEIKLRDGTLRFANQMGSVGFSGFVSTARNIDLTSSASTIDVGSSSELWLDGTLSDAGSLNKRGLGVLTLSGHNNYAGPTSFIKGHCVSMDPTLTLASLWL